MISPGIERSLIQTGMEPPGEEHVAILEVPKERIRHNDKVSPFPSFYTRPTNLE